MLSIRSVRLMHLTKLKVRNYLSVNGECELPIDGRVTILLGANDHGKSNLLRALEHLNFGNAIKEDDQNWYGIDYGALFKPVWQLQ